LYIYRISPFVNNVCGQTMMETSLTGHSGDSLLALCRSTWLGSGAKNYETLAVVGHGAYGTVYKGRKSLDK
jgi:hypothetical protein